MPDRRRLTVVLLVILAAALGIAAFLRGMDRYSDEGHHLRQVAAFCRGERWIDPKLTVPPGFHLLAALAGRALGDCSLATIRGVNLGFGLLSVGAFLFAALATPTERPLLRTLQYFALPILLPYHFLVYTDPLALAILLFGVGLLLRRRYRAAGLVIAASLLVRQTQAVWLLLVCLYAVVEERGASLGEQWRRLWPSLLALAAVAAFVIVHGGIALGDAAAHRPGLHLGNLCLALLLLVLVFLPDSVAVLWQERARLRRPALLAAMAAAATVSWLGLRLEHAYNRFPGFLHNDLLAAVEQHAGVRAAVAAAVALAVAVVWCGRLARPSYHSLYPVAALSLLPAKLVEHRYALPALVLYLLFRKDRPVAVEAATLGFEIAVSALVLVGLQRGAFAL
jgi:alpha-1,2-glucosyltransferase